jgi:hypothetical protein
MVLVGELCQVTRERAWLRQVRANHRALFPHLPEDSRFCRRAQALRTLLGALRASILYWVGEDVTPLRLLDSFPMPLCACYRIRQSSLPISGSSFAFNSSKQEYYFGLHPGLLLTERGYIEEVFLAPGYLVDVPLMTAYLDVCIEEGRCLAGQVWIADKGFVSTPLREAAQALLYQLRWLSYHKRRALTGRNRKCSAGVDIRADARGAPTRLQGAGCPLLPTDTGQTAQAY